MRPHAPAHIQQEEQIDRHFLGGEVADLANLPALPQLEVFPAQPGNRAIVPVQHLHVDARQRHIAAKHHVAVGGHRR